MVARSAYLWIASNGCAGLPTRRPTSAPSGQSSPAALRSTGKSWTTESRSPTCSACNPFREPAPPAHAPRALHGGHGPLQHAGMPVIPDDEEELLLATLLHEPRRSPAQHMLQLLVVGHQGGPLVRAVFRTSVRTIPIPPRSRQGLSPHLQGSPSRPIASAVLPYLLPLPPLRE